MAKPTEPENEASPRDLAARAAWLSFVGGLTQDQIAADLGISRQRVQRLVARAQAEGLIRVRIAHPIAVCLELERALKARFGLESAWVSPDVGTGGDPLGGLAPFAAPVIERIFLGEKSRSIAVGTGRTLRGVVEHMQSIDGSHHKLVSLIGNVAPDGSASFYEVIMRLAEKTTAPHYQMSIPVVARSPEELELFRSLPHVQATRVLAAAADIAIVGIGQMGRDAPLLVDGFISPAEQAELEAAGAVGEMLGNIFDSDGVYLDHPINSRIVGVRVPTGHMSVLCIAAGASKVMPLRAALAGKLMSGLITDETTAKALLKP